MANNIDVNEEKTRHCFLPLPALGRDAMLLMLTWAAGSVDAISYLGLGHVFTAMMTGNTVLLGIALAEADFGAAAQSAIIIAAFLLGVAASAVLGRRVPLVAVFGMEAAAIVAAAWIAPVFAAPVLAFAMGLQNATMTRFTGTSLNTVVLTGNLQKMMQGLLGRFTGAAKSPGSDVAQSTMIAGLWIAYLAGVVAGALADHWIAHPLLPIVLLLPLALVRRPNEPAG